MSMTFRQRKECRIAASVLDAAWYRAWWGRYTTTSHLSPCPVCGVEVSQCPYAKSRTNRINHLLTHSLTELKSACIRVAMEGV